MDSRRPAFWRFTPPFPHFVALASRTFAAPDKLRSMFQNDTGPKQLYLVPGGKERGTKVKGVGTMNTLHQYKFAEFKSESSVASSVTVLVCAWFLVAAGAILADPASPYTQRPVAQAAAQVVTTIAEAPAPRLVPVVATGPDARFTITVEAKRLKV
jgi:hypothetical protein